jgi:hypothetical protein
MSRRRAKWMLAYMKAVYPNRPLMIDKRLYDETDLNSRQAWVHWIKWNLWLL